MTQDSDIVCAHFLVRGQVQGVFYRASTLAMAHQLGICGWVRNLENGDVKLIACGRARQLDELEKWLWQGPATARVSDVQRVPAPPQAFSGFEIRR